MKRIITILIILLILVVLGLIVINKLELRNTLTIETFDPSSSATNIPSSSATNTIVSLDGDEGLVHSVNVDTIRDKFYITPKLSRTPQSSITNPVSCNNTDKCNANSDCDSTQECVDINEDGSKQCYNVMDKMAYELESAKGGHITIKNMKDKNTFNFSLGLILKNVVNEKYIISSKSKLWALKNKHNNIYLVVKGINANDFDEIKICNSDIFCYKYYTLQINVSDKVIKVNFDNQPNSSEIFLKLPSCTTNTDCIDGNCSGLRGHRECFINSDTYYIGKSDENYYDMFVGDINVNLNSVSVESTKTCGFYGKPFKNKRVCLETCQRMNCDSSICENECSTASKCEFEAVGRHSIHCLQECIKNEDCDSNYCREACEKCGSQCPWYNTESDGSDSQYYDPEGKPSPLKLLLNTISTDGTKVSVTWKEPFAGKLYIKGYISYLSKTFNKSEGVKVNKMLTKNCIGDIGAKKCDFVIHDLIPNETYTLGVKSYNGLGLSEMSNLITFKASVTNINIDLKIDEVDDNDVGEYNYCNIDTTENGVDENGVDEYNYWNSN
jgi:hypothetical protein